MRPTTPPFHISDVKLKAAPSRYVRSGLLGWISCTIGDSLRVYGVSLRRTRTGRLALSFPAKRDRHGRVRVVLAPTDDYARRSIESQIFRAIGIEEAPS